jgi:phytoene dehydrogenase-like protein
MKQDVVVVGSGPNGLAAAIALAMRGRSVLVREAQAVPGGGARTLPLTLEGFRHDVCSAVHPLALASPFFRTLRLEEHGLRWLQPEVPVAHPLDEGPAVLLERSTAATAEHLDAADRRAWPRLFDGFARDLDALLADLMGPMLSLPGSPLLMARFGALSALPATWLARLAFRGPRARALFAGNAAHSVIPLGWPASSAFGLLLATAGHAVGWPIPRGGSQSITDALTACLRAHGGEIVVDAPVDDVDELDARTVLFDVGPRQLLRIAGRHLPDRYRRTLERFRYGPGNFKLDWALSGPIPWRDPAVGRAGTVHLGGTLEQLTASERAPWRGEICERPYVLLAQPSLIDPTRAPPGRHTAWAYCHVPHASEVDMTAHLEAQVERAAPGFRDLILARHVTSPRQMEARNANMVGGDLSGGANSPDQLLARPRMFDPYRVPGGRDWWLCSASTPPGGGVHGMCGWQAARRVG